MAGELRRKPRFSASHESHARAPLLPHPPDVPGKNRFNHASEFRHGNLAIQPPAFVKGFHELGLAKAGIRLMPSAEAIDEADLQNLGDLAVGIISASHYTAAYNSPANKAFVAAWKKAYGADKDPDLFAAGAYDGMALVYDVVKKLNGKFDGDAAMGVIKGWTHESPRGPISIDPETRDIVQNVYICRVEKVDGRLANVVIDTYPAVKDPWKQRNK